LGSYERVNNSPYFGGRGRVFNSVIHRFSG
jgi:hypothetical protein